MKNRFGINLRKGDTVSVAHPRGGRYEATVKSFETKGSFALAYGPRVVFSNGMSASLDDCAKVTN